MKSPEGIIEELMSMSDSARNKENQKKVEDMMSAIMADPKFSGREIFQTDDGRVVTREGEEFREVTLSDEGKVVVGNVAVPFEPRKFEPRPPRKVRQPHPDAK